MKYLLDTHTFIWLDSNEQELSDKVKSILIDTTNMLYLSSVSLWEMQIKLKLGKLKPLKSLEAIWEEQSKLNGIFLLNIDIKHIFNLSNIPEIHSDPFDRLIISQAQIEKMVILTRDQNIHRYDVKSIWK